MNKKFMKPQARHSMKKRKSERKDSRLEVRVPYGVKLIWQEAANNLGLSLAAFVITYLNESATRVIKDREIMTLSIADQIQFFNALQNPPEPNQKLIEAFRYHKKIVGS